MRRWPWSLLAPAPSPTATVDVAAVVDRAVARAAAETRAEVTAAFRTELDRVAALVPNSPIPVAAESPSPYPVYAYDRPFNFLTPQAPTRRPDALVDVPTLRRLADTYDVLRSCIQHLKREVLSVPVKIAPRCDSDMTKAAKVRMEAEQAWFETEGGLGGAGTDREVLEGMVLEDLLVIGAGAVYFHATRGGGLHEVLAIDAATIRPRVDAFGWPGPDEIAYEQWVYGVLVGGYTREQLRYAGLATHARSYTPYFASPVEYLVYTISTALKSDHWNRSWLTDGNTPADILSLPAEWTPEQVMTFAEWWDGLLAGDVQGRQKTRFVPGGSGRLGNPSRKDQEFQAFELWLLRRTCAVMGVQPASIGFVGEQYKVTQGESMAATTQFGAGPLLAYRKSLYDYVLRRRGAPDLECRNVTQAEEDAKNRAERNRSLIESGQRTPNEARLEDGKDPLPGGDTLFISSSLVPVEQAAKPPASPAPASPEGSEEEESPTLPRKPDEAAPDEADPEEGTPAEEQRAALRQWERKALNRLRLGKGAACDFVSDAIPAKQAGYIRLALSLCRTAEDVRRVLRYDPAQPRDRWGKWVAYFSPDNGAGSGGGSGSGTSFQADSEQEASDWAERNFGSWAPSLTPDEHEVVRHYQGEGHLEINDALRAAGGDVEAVSDPRIREQITHLESAIAKGTLQEDTTVFRGVDPAVLRTRDPDQLVGSTFNEPGFISTSLLRERAEEFGETAAGEHLLLEIQLKRGTHGAYLDLATGASEYEAEYEVLLNRSPWYHVLEAKEDSGRFHLIVGMSDEAQ